MKTITNHIPGILALSLLSINVHSQSYCIPPGFKPMGGSGEPFTYISNVQLGDLNNSSGMPTGIGDDNGYTHFTNAGKPVLEPGKTYSLKVTAMDNLGSGMEVAVWVDWNGDKEFQNITEKVAFWAPSGQHSADFTVPTNAKLGETRMRVYCDMPSSMGHIPAEPCGYLNYPGHAIGQHGEVEDYTLVIGNFIGIEKSYEETNVNLYPVPADRILNVDLPFNHAVYYRIIDMFGRIVLEGRLDQSISIVAVGDLSNGQYSMLITNYSQVIHKSFTISH